MVDRKLYTDGGLVNWAPLSEQSLNYSNTWLRAGDLDIDNEGFPQQVVLAKDASVPSTHGGVLWPDEANKVIYQYGGDYANDRPETFRLWFYDIVYNTWNTSNASTTDINRASYGAGAVAQDKAKGYYYGGWLTSSSVPGFSSEPVPLANMLEFDMLKSSFRNQSGPDSIRRAEGVMLYVPAGDSGMLVYFGGLEFPNEKNLTEVEGKNMTEILVYSIGDDLWYLQTATGEVPEARRRFCAGAAWAEDRSSYNIYLYGGASIEEGVGFGDVYVLSLPSFTWIKFWPRPEDKVGATFPHHSLTCDVINNNTQMIIMGGHFPNMTTECDVPVIYGQHGLDLGKANPDGAKWAKFDPNITEYRVPSEITDKIGGGPGGGATRGAPEGGWAERDLEVQFSRAYTPATRESTRAIPQPTKDSDSNGSNKATVIGGAVGGAVGALILVGLIACCVFHRRKDVKKGAERNRAISELPSNSAILPNNAKSPVTETQMAPFHAPRTNYTGTPDGSPTVGSSSQYARSPHASPNAGNEDWGYWGHSAPAPAYSGHSPRSSRQPRDIKLYSTWGQPHELPAERPSEMQG